jgi:hypothetical protein
VVQLQPPLFATSAPELPLDDELVVGSPPVLPLEVVVDELDALDDVLLADPPAPPVPPPTHWLFVHA